MPFLNNVRGTFSRNARAWSDIQKEIKEDINKNLYATDPGSPPYSSFITRKRLATIWQRPRPKHGSQTPFSIFCRCTNEHLTFEDFCANLIQLISALLYADWARVTDKNDDCCVRWAEDQSRLCIPSGSSNSWVELSDANLPLDEHQIQLLFRAGNGNQVLFRDYQCQFKPLVIKAGTLKPQHYPKGTRPPFESVKAMRERKGWYGDVEAVRIVEGHLEWKRPEPLQQKEISTANQLFAVKTFRVNTNFFDEHDNLILIGTNAMKHDHIMMHIAAFVIDTQFRILFQWAWIDLHHFFLLDPQEYLPWLPQANVSPFNLLKEAQSLGEALAFLHEGLRSFDFGPRSLFHMDLKSDNILVVSPSETQLSQHPLGVWKITDFGLSDYSISTKMPYTMIGDVLQSIASEPSSSHRQRQMGPFQAPEAERPPSGGVDQAKADVWSLGCVHAELLAFSAHGPIGVQKLRACLRRQQDPDQQHRNGYFYSGTRAGVFELVAGLDGFLSRPYDPGHELNGWFAKTWQFIKDTTLAIEPQKRPRVADFCEDLRQWAQLSATPRHCLFSDPALNAHKQTPLVSSTEGTATHWSEPVARSERELDNRIRSSSGPPQPPRISIPHHTRIPSQGERQLSPTGIEHHWSGASTPNRSEPARQSVSSTSPRLQQTTTWPASSNMITQPLDIRGQVNSLVPRSSFLALSPDGRSIAFSNGKQIAWSQLSEDFSMPLLREVRLDTKQPIDASSLHASVLSMVVQEGNQKLVLYSLNELGLLSSRPLLSHLTADRDIKRLCMSSTQCLAIEFLETVEIFDRDGQQMLWHPKTSGDLISDLKFDQDGNHLFAISSTRYWIWQHNRHDPSKYIIVSASDCGLTESMKGFQRPGIICTNGSKTFLIQDLELQREKNVTIIVVDAHGPRKQDLTASQGGF